jgi:hypothetical protein
MAGRAFLRKFSCGPCGQLWHPWRRVEFELVPTEQSRSMISSS